MEKRRAGSSGLALSSLGLGTMTWGRDTDEIDRYCARVGFNRIAHMPDIDAIRRSRLKKKTLFEMDDSDDIVMARAEYLRLAKNLWHSVTADEGVSPEPLPDREIFELLGFD